MPDDAPPLFEIAFEAAVIHWRGPSPFFFLAVPSGHVDDIREAARSVSYGWGMVPVAALIGAVNFSTALFPKDDGYLLPLKDAVRKRANVALGDTVAVAMTIAAR